MIKLLSMILVLLTSNLWATSPTHNFTSGTTISSSQVNANFSELYQRMPVKVLHFTLNTNTTANMTATVIPAANITNTYIDTNILSYSSGTYTVNQTGLYRLTSYIKFTTGAPEVNVYINGTDEGNASVSRIYPLTSGQTLEFWTYDMGTSTVELGTTIFLEKMD